MRFAVRRTAEYSIIRYRGIQRPWVNLALVHSLLRKQKNGVLRRIENSEMRLTLERTPGPRHDLRQPGSLRHLKRVGI